MGLLDSLRGLLGRGAAAPDSNRPTNIDPWQTPASAGGGNPSLSVTLRLPDCVQLSGTTTTCKDAMLGFARRHGIDRRGGCRETVGRLRREPDNPKSDKAIAVVVEGERVGYLPGAYLEGFRLIEGVAKEVPVQIFTALLPKGLRCEAWVWLGDGTPEWLWSETNRPPMSPQEKAAANHRDNVELVREGLAEGGERAEEFRHGMVNGVHYLETVEPIRQLKREGRLDEALALCMQSVQAAENEAVAERAEGLGREPAPWYTEQAAIVLRKLGRLDEEEALLRRYLDHVPPESMGNTGPRGIRERLDKLVAKRAKAGK